jgi:hypothetical protein
MKVVTATIGGRFLGAWQYRKQKAAEGKRTDILNQFKWRKIQPEITIETK